jgi:hypothetical protein
MAATGQRNDPLNKFVQGVIFSSASFSAPVFFNGAL